MNKYLILTSLFAFALGIEATGQKKDLKDRTPLISWPTEFEPEKSKFFVHNEIEISAPPEVVWNILIDALTWESWYVGAKNVSLINPSDKVLQADSQFNWETMGLKFPNTTIKEFEPNRLLAWESRIKSIQGYHFWLIVPTAEGCKVITEEAQNGWLTFFEKTFQGKKLHQLHDVWLGEMKLKAEKVD
ncbi:SRPBCC family protein [Aquiflexum gelatinilyticum]|uniref:SRPBCC family protein n=1 Tax=Aquiflexum gelatinilyticum TaxID=2961943 RepID=A0A9X2T0G7_9BACT|nr:SRPBCC family protein [Aquiflexum gelatinilyticum]MCR9015573.1 SRPBCC family protein [Aquiflexum gelatinilyticum]